MGEYLPYEIRYESSAGDTLRLDAPPFVAAGGSLFDSAWQFTTAARPLGEGGRLISRRRACDEKKLELYVFGETPENLAAELERLSELTAYDVEVMSPGRLWVGDRYLECYCVESKKNISPDFPRMAEVTLTILPEQPVWCSEVRFGLGTAGRSDVTGHKYKYAYPYRYGSGSSGIVINNDRAVPQPMCIRFYGPGSSPRICVGSSEIGVTGEIPQDSYVCIDQRSREIYQVSPDGGRINLFDSRIKNGKTFEYLKPGSSIVSCDGADSVEITVIYQRSEPRWSN